MLSLKAVVVYVTICCMGLGVYPFNRTFVISVVSKIVKRHREKLPGNESLMASPPPH